MARRRQLSRRARQQLMRPTFPAAGFPTPCRGFSMVRWHLIDLPGMAQTCV